MYSLINRSGFQSEQLLYKLLLLCCSLLIYTLSKERQRASNESYESWLSAVVQHILRKAGISGVIIGNRILNVFRKKIGTLSSKMKCATKVGGRAVKALVNVWEIGPKYKFTIFYNELDIVNFENENKELKGEKRKLEQNLEVETTKRLRAEEQLKSLNNEVKAVKEKSKKKFKQIVNKVAKLISNKKTRGPDKNKSFSNYSKRHQLRVRNQLKDQCSTALSFLGHYNFLPSRIELYNCETDEVESVTLPDNEFLLDDVENTTSECEINNLNMWLYIKDKFNISNEAWHEIAMKSDEPPCLNKIIKNMKKLNQNWKVKPTPGEVDGVQISFKESIVKQIRRLKSNGVIQDGETIKVKVSGDGTNIGKRINVVNITFTILNEKQLAMSEKGNYILAIIKEAESYDTLSTSISDLVAEMQPLKEISVDDVKYNLEYFLGGDWKFLACVCGIGAANADYACIWCKCAHLDRCDTTKQWSILDAEKGARKLDEIEKNARSRKENCKSKPLFEFIPLSHVVIDTLHLFLRVSDNLIALLVRELKFSDAIAKKNKFPNGFNREKFTHMARYEAFLQDLGIPFRWYVGKETKQLEYRDLTGPEKVKVFQNIKIASLLPNSKFKGQIQEIWDGYWDITTKLKNDFNAEEVKQFETTITSWLQKFLTVYEAKAVTPYMHALYAHVPEFLNLYINLEQFTQQGMEKYNDVTSKNFFRSSNHRGVSALEQIFYKKCRVQYLENAGCARVKKQYT